ncbi:MAG: hypothetical protein ACRCX2_19490 [Paraclostridium sp.]
MFVLRDGSIRFNNKPRRNRKIVYNVLKTNYNHSNGDVINTYCVQRFSSKTLDYFVEVIPKNDFEFVITAESLGLKTLTLKNCRDIVKELIYGI